MGTAAIPLEDELGDVLDKALCSAGMTIDEVARAGAIATNKIQDAIDYRSELTDAELSRLATVLDLNEVGLCALARGRYPLPAEDAWPDYLQPLRMPHGVGVVNAYLLRQPESGNGILFDAGPGLNALLANWPTEVTRVTAVFLTHLEPEHAGGLCDLVEYFGLKCAYVPAGCDNVACGVALAEGESQTIGAWTIVAHATPGHALAHNCYHIMPAGGQILAMHDYLIAGDLIFAGSGGGAYHSCFLQRKHLRRVLSLCRQEDTIIAPGHGPMTTVANEKRYNPFYT